MTRILIAKVLTAGILDAWQGIVAIWRAGGMQGVPGAGTPGVPTREAGTVCRTIQVERVLAARASFVLVEVSRLEQGPLITMDGIAIKCKIF